MEFALSSEQQMIFDVAAAFGEEHIKPFAEKWEEEGTIPRALWEGCAELGFGGLYVSEEFGGAGLDRLGASLVIEALSRSCPSVAAFLSIHNMCAGMIDRYGAAELKARLLPEVVAMSKIMSYCLTEPGAGSDAAALRTRAVPGDGGYTVSGTKAFISGGGYSDAYVVMSRTGGEGHDGISALIVEDGCDGLSFGALEKKMGWKAQPTRQVQLDGCHVPQRNLLGEEGAGFRYAMAGLDGGRVNIAACSLGAAQAALEATVVYMSERKAFGRSIDQFQALQFRLADMEIRLQAARVFLRQAAWKLDQGAPDASRFCAMAKAFVTEAGSDVADACLQLHGGYGYLADYGIEKILRDLRVHQILEGTNEIMRVIVARHVMAAA